METTQKERDNIRRLWVASGMTPNPIWKRALKDADRLAAIERDVRELADGLEKSSEKRCGCCDPEIVGTMGFGCSCQNAGDAVAEGADQEARKISTRLRAILDSPEGA